MKSIEASIVYFLSKKEFLPPSDHAPEIKQQFIDTALLLTLESRQCPLGRIRNIQGIFWKTGYKTGNGSVLTWLNL
jgi:hypothetical protein